MPPNEVEPALAELIDEAIGPMQDFFREETVKTWAKAIERAGSAKQMLD